MSKPQEQVLSFLDPAEVEALGGLPAEAVAGLFDGKELSAATFRPNRLFVEFMHMTIRESGPLDPGLQEAARARHNGWVYVVDLRTPHAGGGAVPPEDIIGGFEVRDGTIVADSYRRNDRHEVFNQHGLVHLPSTLRAVFVARLRPEIGRA